MGLFNFLFHSKDDDGDDGNDDNNSNDEEEEEGIEIDQQEVDETLEIVYDPEYDEWEGTEYIKSTDPPKEREEGDEDEDDGPDTDKIQTPWWWPFK